MHIYRGDGWLIRFSEEIAIAFSALSAAGGVKVLKYLWSRHPCMREEWLVTVCFGSPIAALGIHLQNKFEQTVEHTDYIV